MSTAFLLTALMSHPPRPVTVERLDALQTYLAPGRLLLTSLVEYPLTFVFLVVCCVSVLRPRPTGSCSYSVKPSCWVTLPFFAWALDGTTNLFYPYLSYNLHLFVHLFEALTVLVVIVASMAACIVVAWLKGQDSPSTTLINLLVVLAVISSVFLNYSVCVLRLMDASIRQLGPG